MPKDKDKDKKKEKDKGLFRSKSKAAAAPKEPEWTKDDQDVEDAVENSDGNKLRQLLSKKGTRGDRIDPKGHTAIHRAALKGSLDMLQILLDSGSANVAALDVQGRIPLHDACRMGHAEVSELLLQQNATSKNAVDNFHLTPLHMACMHGKKSCVQLLLRHNVNVDAVDNEQRTPLFYTARLGHVDICKLLVDKRANYNARDAKRKTPLILAVEGDKGDVCDYLIEAGADVTLADSSNKTALQYAKEKNRDSIVRSLQRASGAHSLDDEKVDGATLDGIKKKSDEVDSGLVPLDEMKRLDEERKLRSASNESGAANFSEMNGAESGDIVPWEEAIKADVDKMLHSSRSRDSEDVVEVPEDTVVPVKVTRGADVADLPDGEVWERRASVSSKSSSLSSLSSEHNDNDRPHLESARDRDSDAEVDEDTIVEHKAPPRQPDVDIAAVEWLNKAEPEVDGGKTAPDDVSEKYAMPYNDATDEHHKHIHEGSDREDKELTDRKHRSDSSDDETHKKHKHKKHDKDRKGSTSSSSSDDDKENKRKHKDSSDGGHKKHEKDAEFAEFEMPPDKHKEERETGEVEEFTMPEHKVKDTRRRSSASEGEHVFEDDVDLEMKEVEVKDVESAPVFAVRGGEDVDVLQRRVSLLESELANNRQSISAMEIDDAQRHRALQDEHERELVALRAQIERLEAKNQSLEKLLADEKNKTKKKRRGSNLSDSSSDEEGGRAKFKELELQLEQRQNEIKDLQAKTDKLHHENLQLNEKISIDAGAGANAARLQQQLDKLDEENRALVEQMAVLAATKSAADHHAHDNEQLKLQLTQLEQERLKDADQLTLSVKREEEMKSIIIKLEDDKRQLAKEADEAKQAVIDAEHDALEKETQALLEEIDRLSADKELLNEQLLKASADNDSLREEARDRALRDAGAKTQIVEATAAKDDLYEKLCDTQMQLMDRSNEKERLEHQLKALEDMLKTTVAEKEGLQLSVKDAEEELQLLRNKKRKSSSSSESDDDKKKVKDKTVVDLQAQLRALKEDNEHLHKKLETSQAESSAKLTEKAHEMEELFKKVEELEEENFTMKGQLLERGNEAAKVELLEAPLQAVSVSHVHAAPTHRASDDQVEELLEENRRLMDEISDLQAARDEARRGEAEVGERSKAVQEGHQHQQDSLENLRSLLLIISTRPKVKDDQQLASDLDKVTASVVALCEASDDDPARMALEEFLADYSRLQDEQESNDQQIATLTANAEDLKRVNAQLEAKVGDLRGVAEHTHGTGDVTLAIGHSEDREQLEHVQAELQASNAELKALEVANENLRRDLQAALENMPADDQGSAMAMKIEDLERVLRNQDKVLEEHKKADNARDDERKRLEDAMEQLQMKNLALLETIAEMDEKFQQSPVKKHKDVQEDLTQLKSHMKEKEEEHDKEIKANEKMIGEMKAVILKLEGVRGKNREQEEEHEKDLTDKNVTILELRDVIDKLEQANKSLSDDLEALKLEKVKDHHSDISKSPDFNFEARIGRLEQENDELRRANERLKIDLDQVALEIDNKQQTPSSNNSFSTSGDVPLSEYTAMIRQKLQELKNSSFDETSRLREDNNRLKGELDRVQRFGADKVKDSGSDSEDDVEAKVVSQAAVHAHQAPPLALLNSETEELRAENVEQKAELVVLKHRLEEMNGKHKKTSDAIADLERKNRELTSRLQEQQTRGNGVDLDEKLETRNRQLEAEVAELTRNLQQERSSRLAQDLVDGRLGNHTTHNEEKEEEIRQLAEDNRTLRKRLRTLEDSVSDSQNGDNGSNFTDNNNNSEVSKLRKQLEDSEKQHREVISTYRTHLLAAVQGHLDPAVKQALVHISNQQ